MKHFGLSENNMIFREILKTTYKTTEKNYFY